MTLAQLASMVLDISLGAAALHLAHKLEAGWKILTTQVADHERRIVHLEVVEGIK